MKYGWSQLAIAELERNIVNEQLRVSEENLKAIEKRFTAGGIAQVDVNRARLSHAENIRLFRQADLQVQVATQQLSNLWGTSDKSLQVNLSSQKLWPKSTHQQVIYAELSGDFPLGDSRQPTYKSLRPFDLVS